MHLTTNYRAWMLLEFCVTAPRTTCDHSEAFPFNLVNWVKLAHGADRSWEPSTFQQSFLRLSSNTSNVALVRLTTSSIHMCGTGNDPLAATMVQRDDSQKFSRNRLGLRRHPLVGLLVETRPTLLEKHRCAPLLVQGHTESRWVFGKPDLYPPICVLHLRMGI